MQSDDKPGRPISKLTHLPDGRIVTPLRIAAARAAALSFFPPLAALTAAIVWAALWRSAFSVSCGDLFFFFPPGDFLAFLAGFPESLLILGRFGNVCFVTLLAFVFLLGVNLVVGV